MTWNWETGQPVQLDVGYLCVHLSQVSTVTLRWATFALFLFFVNDRKREALRNRSPRSFFAPGLVLLSHCNLWSAPAPLNSVLQLDKTEQNIRDGANTSNLTPCSLNSQEIAAPPGTLYETISPTDRLSLLVSVPRPPPLWTSLISPLVKKEICLNINRKHKQLQSPRLLRSDDTRLNTKVWC